MLVLNKLPNIQVLNGRSTKEEDEEDERDDEEEEDDDNERESNANKIGSCMYSELEPIEEMQNCESNMNYYSEYNNNNTNNNNNNNHAIHSVKQNEQDFQDDNNINEGNDNYNEEDEVNDDEYNNIDDDDNGDGTITNNDNINKNNNNNEYTNADTSSPSPNVIIPSVNSISNINNPPLIDITTEELSSLSLPSSPSLFTSLLSTIDTLTSQSTLQSFTSSLSHLEAQKPTIPNCLYAFNVLSLQHSTLKQILTTSITPSTPNFPGIYTSLLSSLFSTFSSLSSLFTLLHSKLPAFASSYTSLQSTLASLQKSNSLLQSRLTFDKAALEKRITQLETENTAMTEKVLKHANTITSALDTQSITTTPQVMLITNRKVASTTRSNQQSVYSSSGAVAHHVQQGISLTTMKDIIADIYKSKQSYDKKCEEMKLPKETMEQHMYTYLNKKYGLKTLIIDWARNIINGIKTYSRKDSAVLLFGKIMRNEQEEEARFAIDKITASINDLLLYSFKSKYPFKSVDDINKMFKKKKSEELIEEEWKGIIYYIYEIEQAKELESKVQSFIVKKFTYMKEHIGVLSTRNSSLNSSMKEFSVCNGNNNSGNSNSNNSTKMTREEKRNLISLKNNNCILYSDFIKLVLDYHIHLRDKQLRNFIVLFRSVDVDKNGVINEAEFATLIRKLNIYNSAVIEDVIYSFLSRIDPFENQKITFSECISLFSTEHVNKTGNALPLSEDANSVITLLEKVCPLPSGQSLYPFFQMLRR